MTVTAPVALAARVAALPELDCQAVRAAVRALPDAFGRSHTHSGLSIRKLDATHFECRAGLDIRILFRHDAAELVLQMVGTHDQVRAFLRNRR